MLGRLFLTHRNVSEVTATSTDLDEAGDDVLSMLKVKSNSFSSSNMVELELIVRKFLES